MRPLLLIVLVFPLCGQLCAQPGAYISTISTEAPYWGHLGTSNASFNGGFGGGVEYVFPLWKGSALLTPGISYARFQGLTRRGGGLNKAHQFSLRAGLRFFPLDWVLPCDCQVYKKGLLAEGFAGWSQWNLSHQEKNTLVEDVSPAFFMGLAGGFSISMARGIRFVPMFRYTFSPSVTWEGLEDLIDPFGLPYNIREETFIRQMSFEIHVLFGS